MKILAFLLVVFTAGISTVHAQNITILDTGHNTRSINSTPAANLFTTQYCFSPTVTDSNSASNGGVPTRLISASYCTNDSERDTRNPLTARIPRVARPLRNAERNLVSQTVGQNPSHGNSVSSAIYDFSRDINHTHIQVFGERDMVVGGSGILTPFSNNGPVVPALQFINEIAQFEDIQAINMSFGTVLDRSTSNGEFRSLLLMRFHTASAFSGRSN